MNLITFLLKRLKRMIGRKAIIISDKAKNECRGLSPVEIIAIVLGIVVLIVSLIMSTR